MMKVLFFLLISFASICFSNSAILRFKREINAQLFSDQDAKTIFDPIKCLQECTRSNSNSPLSNRTIANTCDTNYLFSLIFHTVDAEILQSIINQPPLEQCVPQCDPNHDNIIGDLIPALKSMVESACSNDTNCVSEAEYPDPTDVPAALIPCKTAISWGPIFAKECPLVDTKQSKAFEILDNTFLTFYNKVAYVSTDKCALTH